MNLSDFFNSKKAYQLFGLENEFNFLKELLIKDKFPNVLMLSGTKGSGKASLVTHLLSFYFDQNNYNLKENTIFSESSFYNQFLENTFSNIIFLNGTEFQNVKVDAIRQIKDRLQKKPIIDDKRFIVFDDVDFFNKNSLNALLRLIEDPGKNNYFILINNKNKTLLDTIKSRSVEVKIIINDYNKKKIINSLSKKFKIETLVNNSFTRISPGNFIKFNYIVEINKLNFEGNLIENINIILDLYQKEKDITYKDFLIFNIDDYLYKTKKDNLHNNEKIFDLRSSLIRDINDFFFYNINKRSFLNSIENKIGNE